MVKQFDAHASTYNQNTPLQQLSAQLLLNQIPQQLNNDVVADIGCGTGALSVPLANRGARVWAIDQSQAMLNQMPVHYAIETIPCDALNLPFPNDSVDVLCSNFALHWIAPSDYHHFLRLVRPQGQAFIALPIQGSLSLVTQQYPQIPIYPFPTLQQVLMAFNQPYWQVSYTVHPLQLQFKQLSDLLKQLKQMGGTKVVSPQLPVHVLKAYLKSSVPVILNYDVLMIHSKNNQPLPFWM